MAFTVTANSYNGGTSDTITVTPPSGTEIGDALVVAVTNRWSNTTGHYQPNTPSGWTKLEWYDADWHAVTIYYMNYPSSAPGSWDFVLNRSQADAYCAQIVRIGNGNGFDVKVRRSLDSTTSCLAGSLSGAASGDMMLVFYAVNVNTAGAATITLPTTNGWSSLGSVTGTEPSNWVQQLGCVYKQDGTDRPTATTNKDADWLAYTVAFTEQVDEGAPPPPPAVPPKLYTDINGLPIPQLTDPALITVVSKFADAVDTRCVSRHATVTARNAAIVQPAAGMVSWCDDTGEIYYRSDASKWISFRPRIKMKSTAESVTSSTTFQDDNDLFVPLDGSSQYKLDFFLNVFAGTAGDMKFRFTGPSGMAPIRSSTGSGFYLGTNTAFTSFDLIAYPITQASQATGTDGLSWRPIWGTTMFYTTQSGTLTLQWAQNASSATATQVGEGSYLKLYKIG